ncbi:hypothetical protein D3C81_1368180 [compost metagenome]
MGRFDFAVGNAANGAGKDFHRIRAGVEGERQQGAIHRVAKECFQQGLRADHSDTVDPAVADQQLDIQRCTTKHIGKQLDRPTQKAPTRDPQNGQGQRQHKAHRNTRHQQPQGHRQPGKGFAVAEQKGFPVFGNQLDHRAIPRTPWL